MIKDAKSKTNRSLILIAAALGIILVATIVLLFVVARKDKALQGADQAIKLSAQGGFSCEYAEAQKLYTFGEGILKVTGNRIAYLTLSGNEVYSHTVNYSNPQCYVNGSKAVVFDMDGYGLTFLDCENVIFEIPTAFKIKSVTISNDDLVGVITEGPDYCYGKIFIFDSDGTQAFEWDSYDSGYPISIAFNEDSTMLAITSLSTSGAVYVPYLRLYQLPSPILSGPPTDIGSFSIDENAIFSTVLYCNDTLYTFSSNTVYTLLDNQVVPLNLDFGAINQVNTVGGVVFIVYSDGVEQMNRLAVINSRGDTIYDSPVGSEINAVATSDSLYALSIDNRIYVFNTSGTIISDISVDEDVLRIGFIGNNKLIIISTGGVHTVDY